MIFCISISLDTKVFLIFVYIGVLKVITWYSKSQIQLSPTYFSDCQNKYSNCNDLASRGACEGYPSWMKSNCPSACNFCNGKIITYIIIVAMRIQTKVWKKGTRPLQGDRAWSKGLKSSSFEIQQNRDRYH